MAYDLNSATIFYPESCGIPSDASLLTWANSGTHYYFNSANDYIIYGQSTIYPELSVNYGSNFYATVCSVSSSPTLSTGANYGTNFYYSSAFNCVTWCQPLEPLKYAHTINSNY